MSPIFGFMVSVNKSFDVVIVAFPSRVGTIVPSFGFWRNVASVSLISIAVEFHNCTSGRMYVSPFLIWAFIVMLSGLMPVIV